MTMTGTRTSRFCVASISVCFLLLLSAFAQPQTSLIPRSVLFGNPERTAPQISPDGSMLAYLAPDQGVLNIWVRTLGKTDDHAITNDRKRGIRNLFWQYDSKSILYAQDQNGDENWRVYQTTVATSKTLSDHPKPANEYHLKTGQRE
jgi:Tol biopolymer transport system component